MTESTAATAGTVNPSTQIEPHKMNIAEAKHIYAQFGAELKRDMSSVVDLVRAVHVAMPLSNSSYLHALTFTDLMFGHTEREFRMITGCTGGDFIGCLKDGFGRMLTRVSKSKGFARLILVNCEDMGPLADLSTTHPALEIQSATVPDDLAVRHFIISDTDMVREEKPHAKITDNCSAEMIKADVFFSNPPKAAALIGEFDAIWNHLKAAAKS